MQSRSDRFLNNGDGSAILVTLLILLAVTVLGVAAINRSVVTLKMTQNEREARETFYLSESAAAEGVQRLSLASGVDKDEKVRRWHHPKKSSDGGIPDFRDPDAWDVDGKGTDNGRPGALGRGTYLAAVEWKVATGSSLIQTAPRLYQNRIYGMCQRHGAVTIVEIGFNLRY